MPPAIALSTKYKALLLPLIVPELVMPPDKLLLEVRKMPALPPINPLLLMPPAIALPPKYTPSPLILLLATIPALDRLPIAGLFKMPRAAAPELLEIEVPAAIVLQSEL